MLHARLNEWWTSCESHSSLLEDVDPLDIFI